MENKNLKRVSSNIFAMVGLVISVSHVSLQEPPKVPPCWALQGLHSARHVIFQHHHVISAQKCVICTAHRAKQCTAMQSSAKQCTTCIYHHRDFPRSAMIFFTWVSCSPACCSVTKKAWGWLLLVLEMSFVYQSIILFSYIWCGELAMAVVRLD